MVPHLLLGRMLFNAAYPEHYYWAASAERLLATRQQRVANVIEYACLPILRIKLVCKALDSAVATYLGSLLQPRGICAQAAATIQMRARYDGCRGIILTSWINRINSAATTVLPLFFPELLP